MKHILFAVLAISLLVPAVSMAHPGHEHKTMGTISAIDGAKLVVKSTEGKDATFELTPATVFKSGTKKGAQADLKAGMRVVVLTAGETEHKAKEVQYSAAATTAKK